MKYGLSVTGLVDPRRLTANDTGKLGDKLILTKALGVGLICTANRVGEAAPGAMDAAVASMTTLNKSAAEISRSYDVHAATDVTGFSFLGHLHEMMGGRLSCRIDGSAVPVLPGAWQAADDCLYTAAGQRNRNHTGPFVRFENVPFAMQEILFDPRPRADCCLPWLRKRLKTSGRAAKSQSPRTNRGRNHREAGHRNSCVLF